jgi:molybdenum cofactor cytidylyltransferase
MSGAAREKRFVSAVVLAAGSSTRFVGDVPKQLTAIDGVSMVRRVAQAALASKASEVIVVTGFQQARVASEVKGLAVHAVYNRRFQQGLSTSVKTGLWAVSDRSSAVLFIPCDQPHLDTTSLDLLVEAYRRGRGSILVPAYRGRRGAPVLFDRKFFAELAAIAGDEGGRQILLRHPAEVVEVELQDEAPLYDFDTVEELEALVGTGTGSPR